jgi:hypothetical protein
MRYVMAGKKTPEKPPTKRETSIAGKALGSDRASSNTKSLAGRVLSEAAAVARQKGKGR